MVQLSAGQSKAVSYTSGPLLILAGPGLGKTLTITEKVVKLIGRKSLRKMCRSPFIDWH